MCEEQPAVKALRFLQTEVFAAVDHTNSEETSAFRALLAHLFSTPMVTNDNSAAKSTGIPKEVVAELDEEPPKKRSRPNTPDETWTSRLDEDDEDMPDAGA